MTEKSAVTQHETCPLCTPRSYDAGGRGPAAIDLLTKISAAGQLISEMSAIVRVFGAELALEERGESLIPDPASEPSIAAAEKLTFVIGMLDAARVRNGWKAISIWLHANWTPNLIARWGEHDNAHTIRRWRARKNKAPG